MGLFDDVLASQAACIGCDWVTGAADGNPADDGSTASSRDCGRLACQQATPSAGPQRGVHPECCETDAAPELPGVKQKSAASLQAVLCNPIGTLGWLAPVSKAGNCAPRDEPPP